MQRVGLWAAAGLATVALCACVGPLGPTIPVAPGPGKSFAAFAADQETCRQYADAQVGPQAAYANSRAVGSALLGTALGAGLGAAGASGAGFAQMSLQQQYDLAYAECMSAHGNRVPGFRPPPGGPGYGGPPSAPPPYGPPGPPPPPPGWTPPPPP